MDDLEDEVLKFDASKFDDLVAQASFGASLAERRDAGEFLSATSLLSDALSAAINSEELLR